MLGVIRELNGDHGFWMVKDNIYAILCSDFIHFKNENQSNYLPAKAYWFKIITGSKKNLAIN